MTTKVAPTDGVLIRAGMYQLLALGYAYPDARQRERLSALVWDLKPWVARMHPDWEQRLSRLAETMAGRSDGGAGGGAGRVDGAAGSDGAVGTEADFNRLFSGGMDCTPHESAYEPDIFRKQHAMADIAGFYKAFKFDLPDGSRWQPDHVGVELEFAAILLQRTAYALEQGWDEQADVCADALRKFLQDHLGRWTAAFTRDLERKAAAPGYLELAALTRDWVESELTALGLAPDRLESRQWGPDADEPPACGGCSIGTQAES